MNGPWTSRRFRDDEGGTIFVFFALGLAALAALIGLAIDYGNASSNYTQLQMVADRVVLAAANGPATEFAARIAAAQARLQTELACDMPGLTVTASVTGNAATGKILARLSTRVRGYISPVVGVDSFAVNVEAAATSLAMGRALDVAMCIDATGSMQFVIDGVIANATGFYANLNTAMAARGLPPFDLIRVRPIFFRDFGGNYKYNAGDGWQVDKFPLGWEVRPAGIFTNYGDDVPLRAPAGFYRLPVQEAAFQAFAAPEVESGGGDYTESGLECLNEAMNSPWLKPGDTITTATGDMPASAVISTIAIWSDENAHEPNHGLSLANPSYPDASLMPRDFAGLAAKWADPDVIPQAGKLLVHFYPNGNPQSGIEPTDGASGWNPVLGWDKYMRGGTLNDGVGQMIDKIADAVATVPTSTAVQLTN
jgi:Flp pilus assembly protein TadG